ncbi:hypothetical protein B0H14DRAFT_2606745 [Mycena olivaceomarginata]|nr:hypothetical protein B0H14DRAFT_2606745 [Mycena olivaceomarginata]
MTGRPNRSRRCPGGIAKVLYRVRIWREVGVNAVNVHAFHSRRPETTVRPLGSILSMLTRTDRDTDGFGSGAILRDGRADMGLMSVPLSLAYALGPGQPKTHVYPLENFRHSEKHRQLIRQECQRDNGDWCQVKDFKGVLSARVFWSRGSLPSGESPTAGDASSPSQRGSMPSTPRGRRCGAGEVAGHTLIGGDGGTSAK